MAGFSVEADSLIWFGEQFKYFGETDMAEVGPYVTRYAGQTEEMYGVLASLAPGIELLAQTFGDHYTALATVVSGTGSGLVQTGQDYARTDQASNAAADATAPLVGDQTDVTADGVVSFQTSVRSLSPTAPGPDPGQAIRSNMDADVVAIDWLFAQVTGHHITEPLNDLVGNWTALTAQGAAWGQAGEALIAYGENIKYNADQVDHVWDGVAARTFKEYGHRLGDGMKGEGEICLAVKLVLDQLAEAFEQIFQTCVDHLESVVHQVEIAAAFLAALWWCGVGEGVAGVTLAGAISDFELAYGVASTVRRVITAVDVAIKAFQALADLFHLVSDLPAAVSGEIEDIEQLIRDVGAIPGVLVDISHIPAEPTDAYGGPGEPAIA
ncbi:MAG: hypothetical protein DLM58_10190 [Pseudonocardiales bacterium]|nr:MAG: hypothetical protein DLM58_10190 [Pseudonocardiales bacterium]